MFALFIMFLLKKTCFYLEFDTFVANYEAYHTFFYMFIAGSG